MKTLALIFFSSIFAITLTACSSSNNANTNTIKEVQTGVVQSVNKRLIKPHPHKSRPYGNVGVSVGSHGHAGVYGSVDVATIGRLLKGPEKPKMFYEILVKRNNGDLVAITQPATVSFKRGDRVKILQREGEARVIH